MPAAHARGKIMSSKLRRFAAISGLALAASVLSVPLAAPARAAAPVDRMWKVFDPNGDGYYGLYYSDAGGSWIKVEDTDRIDITELSSSADGTRIIYVRNTATYFHTDVQQELVVRDTSNRVVRVLEKRMVSTGSYMGATALSPDGTRAVWELYDDVHKTFATRKVLIGSTSASTVLASGLSPYAFLTNDTVLVQDVDGRASTIPFAGGTRLAAPGVPGNAFGVRMSPDGTHLAWGLLTNSAAPYTARLEVAPFTVTNGALAVGVPLVLDSTAYNRSPSWSRDSSTIFYLRRSGAQGAFANLYSAAADGSTPPALLQATSADETDVDVTSLPSADTTPPGGVTLTPTIVLQGSTVPLSWTLPADADLSGVIISAYSGATASGEAFKTFVPAPNTSTNYCCMGLGNTATFAVAAVDRYGNVQTDPQPTHTLTAIEAFPRPLFDPTSSASPTLPFKVRLGSDGPAWFTVDYMPAGTTTWKRWATHHYGAVLTFGSPASAGVNATVSSPGLSVAFRVLAEDQYGNSTRFTGGQRAVVPFDQTKAVFSGGETITHQAAWLGSYRRISRSTDYAKVRLYGSRISIIGWWCYGCGKFDLYDGSTLIATVATESTSFAPRMVLYSKSYSSSAWHTYTIRPHVPPGYRTYILIDGFAMRR